MIITLLLVEWADEPTLLMPIKNGEVMNLNHFAKGANKVTRQIIYEAFPIIFGDDWEMFPASIDILKDHQAELDLPDDRWLHLTVLVSVSQPVMRRLEEAGYTITRHALEKNRFPPHTLTRAAIAAFLAAFGLANDEDSKTNLDELTN